MSLLISCEVHETSPPQIDPPDGSLAGRAGNRLAGVSPRRSLHSSGTAGTGTAVAIGSSGGGGGGGGGGAASRLRCRSRVRCRSRLRCRSEAPKLPPLTSGGGGGGGIADSFRAVLGPIPWSASSCGGGAVGGGGVSGTEMKTRDEGS